VNHPGQRNLADLEMRSMVVDAMLDAVIVADPQGVIRLWNRGAEVIFGFSPDEAIGRTLDLIVPVRFRQAHAAGFSQALASGRLRTEGKVLTTRANHKYGSRLYVDFSFGLLKDSSGALSGVFAVGRDVTARHLGEAAMKLAP
jgi:PAS domain S-box-containing protein